MQARPNILYINTHDVGLADLSARPNARMRKTNDPAGAVMSDPDGLPPREQPMPVVAL